MLVDEMLKLMLRSFFVITTGIVVSMYVFCLIFNPEAAFSLEDIGRILLMAIASDIPFIIFYSQKELNRKKMSIRFVIHFLVLLAILLYFAHLWDWVHLKSLKEIVVFILLIIGVYAIVLTATTYQDQKLADKLNESLKQRYH